MHSLRGAAAAAASSARTQPALSRTASHWAKFVDLVQRPDEPSAPPSPLSTVVEQPNLQSSNFRAEVDNAAHHFDEPVATASSNTPEIKSSNPRKKTKKVKPPTFHVPKTERPPVTNIVRTIDSAQRWVKALNESSSLRTQEALARKAFDALGKAYQQLHEAQRAKRPLKDGESLMADSEGPDAFFAQIKSRSKAARPKKKQQDEWAESSSGSTSDLLLDRSSKSKLEKQGETLPHKQKKKPKKKKVFVKHAVGLEEESATVDKDPADVTPTYSRRVEGILAHSSNLTLEDIRPVESEQIPKLAHGLDRVLFNPSVHWFQDPHSKVFNFDPSVQQLPSVTDFAFDRVTGFIPSSRDMELGTLAKEHSKRFTGSTSSLSGFLSHIYYLISGHKPPDMSVMSQPFQKLERLKSTFSGGTTIPAEVVFRKSETIEGGYALDSAKSNDGKNILLYLGTVLEKYLTLPPETFGSLLKGSDKPPPEEQREQYRYAKSSKFVMRSQLDCYDPRLPGTGVFDLKTRACIAIRRDMLNWENNSGYQIIHNQGLLESFEREYFDLIRSAFLKYQFQARIGNMDGVLVAYHNTDKFYGFQYIPLVEMDARIFGPTASGEKVFAKCIGLLEALSEEIVSCYPGQSVSCLVECQHPKRVLNVWVRPYSQDANAEEGPMSLLTVTTMSSSKGKRLEPSEAINKSSRTSMPWDLHYRISRSALSDSAIKTHYNRALERSNMTKYLPEGMNLADFLPVWHSINYGTGEAETASVPELDTDPGAEEDLKASLMLEYEKLAKHDRPLFAVASKTVQQIRRIAQKGKAQQLLEESTKAKVAAADAQQTTSASNSELRMDDFDLPPTSLVEDESSTTTETKSSEMTQATPTKESPVNDLKPDGKQL